MMHFLMNLTYWHWFTFGIILLIIEILATNTGFLLWIAIASGLVGAVLWLFPHLDSIYQLTLFAIVSLLYSVIGKKYLQLYPIRSDKPTLNKRNQQYIDRTFVLETAIENGRGMIRVDDSIWYVSGPDLPAGTHVKVIGAESSILKVVAI